MLCMISEASQRHNRADRYGRKAIAGLATTGALFFGVNTENTSFDAGQTNISTIEQHVAPTPTIVKIGMVAVSDGIDKKYWSSATIQAVTMNELETVRISTGDMWRFQSGGVANVVERPEGTFKNTGKPCYTVRQLETIEEDVRQLNKQRTQNENVQRRMNGLPAARDMTLTYINTDLACNADSAGGWATGDRNNARAYFDIPVMSTGTIVHEVGHLLSPDGDLGLYNDGKSTGLSHQREFTCQKISDKKTIVQQFSTGTIQELLTKNGCYFKQRKDERGNSDDDPYASYASVMGKTLIAQNTWRGSSSWVEAFSPAELAYLDPTRIVESDVSEGKYYLSYERDKLFGLRFTLPDDHVLRSADKTADSIFIGPTVDGYKRPESKEATIDTDTVPRNETQTDIRVEDNDADALLTDSRQTSKSLGVFITSKDGRYTSYINTNYRKVYESSYAGFDAMLYRESAATRAISSHDVVLYADEELDLLVLGGSDKNGTYVKVKKVSDPISSSKLQHEKELVAERNSVFVGNKLS